MEWRQGGKDEPGRALAVAGRESACKRVQQRGPGTGAGQAEDGTEERPVGRRMPERRQVEPAGQPNSWARAKEPGTGAVAGTVAGPAAAGVLAEAGTAEIPLELAGQRIAAEGRRQCIRQETVAGSWPEQVQEPVVGCTFAVLGTQVQLVLAEERVVKLAPMMQVREQPHRSPP